MRRLLGAVTICALQLVLSQSPLLARQTSRPLQLKEALKDFPRSQLQIRSSGPISLDLNSGARASYQTLADMAGINIIFDGDFHDMPTAFHVNSADILSAFDLLSAKTGNFVEFLDSHSVIVAPEAPTKHLSYDVTVLKTFYPANGASPQNLTNSITALRTLLNARYIAVDTAAGAILLNDTPERIVQAEKILAGLDHPEATATPVAGSAAMATTAAGHLLVDDANGVHSTAPGRTPLHIDAGAPHAFKMNEDSRTSFEMLARMAGLNVIFDQDFQSPDAVHFEVDNVDVLDALDLLAIQTKSFWQALDSNTIIVAADNQSKRRGIQTQILKTFYLPSTTTAQALTELITALRTLLNCRYIAQAGTLNAISVRDIPNKIALVEKIVDDLTRSQGGYVASTGFSVGVEGGVAISSVLNRRAARAVMATPVTFGSPGSLTINLAQTVRTAYETVAALAGQHVIFDSKFADNGVTSLKLNGVNVQSALDFLSLQTSNQWDVMDGKNILVTSEPPNAPSDLQPRISKTIALPGLTPVGVTEIVTALRTLLNLRQIEGGTNAVVIQDTADRVALAERVIADLTTLPGRKAGTNR